MNDVIDIFKYAIDKSVSDIFIVAGTSIGFKVKGEIIRQDSEVITPTHAQDIITEIYKIAHRSNIIKENKIQDDFSFAISGIGRFRANIYCQRGSYAAVIRCVRFDVPSYMDIGIPMSIMDLAKIRKGLILITGPAGAGKTTTISCILNEILKNRTGHVITLEDPIEFVHSHNKSIISQREVGTDVISYKEGLKAALRQAPDVIFLGEMRDYETIQIAITAAETGQLVVSTLHTLGAVNTIDRIIDVFPATQQNQIRIQLSMVLETIVSQQLINTSDGKLIPIFDIIKMNYATRNMIREGKLHQLDASITGENAAGIQRMDTELIELYKKGKISSEQAKLYSINHERMCKKIENIC